MRLFHDGIAPEKENNHWQLGPWFGFVTSCITTSGTFLKYIWRFTLAMMDSPDQGQ